MGLRNRKTERGARDFGETIARFRTQRGWSRARFLHHIYMKLDEDADDNSFVSETWLARLERGDVVKIDREMVDLLANALDCTAEERVRLLLAADRNVIAPPDGGTDPLAVVLNTVMQDIYQEAHALLSQATSSQHWESLSDEDIQAIIYTALRSVMDRSDGRRP